MSLPEILRHFSDKGKVYKDNNIKDVELTVCNQSSEVDDEKNSSVCESVRQNIEGDKCIFDDIEQQHVFLWGGMFGVRINLGG